MLMTILPHKAQWRSVLKRLSEALSRHGTDGIGDGDYYLDTDEVSDRFLFVELTQESMLGPSLLTTVHQVVAACPEPYSVDICRSSMFLKTRAGEPYPDFNIFVEKDRILVFSESLTLLKVLGISDATPLPDDAD